jgi:hypothetical protein
MNGYIEEEVIGKAENVSRDNSNLTTSSEIRKIQLSNHLKKQL